MALDDDVDAVGRRGVAGGAQQRHHGARSRPSGPSERLRPDAQQRRAECGRERRLARGDRARRLAASGPR